MSKEFLRLTTAHGEVVNDKIGIYAIKPKMRSAFAYVFPEGLWWAICSGLTRYELKMLLCLVSAQTIGGLVKHDYKLVQSVAAIDASSQSRAIKTLLVKELIHLSGWENGRKVYRISPWVSFMGSAQQLELVRTKLRCPESFQYWLQHFNMACALLNSVSPLPAPPPGECATSDFSPPAEGIDCE